jgi:type IV pilus assembly protein PilY1
MNLFRKFAITLSTFVLVLCAGPGYSDDTDIYYAKGSVAPDSEPLVMFSLDWRPNLGATKDCDDIICDELRAKGYLAAAGPYTFFDILRAVLQEVMNPLEGVKVGLMINHDYQALCAGKPTTAGCSNGGYMALGARSFQEDDANGAKEAFHTYLKNMPTPQGNASHMYQGKELFFEMYRYLTGQGVYNGHVGYLDYQTDKDFNMDVDTPLTMWDTSIESGDVYISPLDGAGSCSKIFTVNMMFQVSQQEDDSDNELKKSVANGGMNQGKKSTFPDVIGWLRDADLGDGTYGTVGDIGGIQNVTSYFIVDPTKINTTTTGYAQAGGTGVPLPLSDDPSELIDTLTDIFKQVLSVSSTFVSASVPVNVFNRAEIIDNVFIALFQPDENSNPFWVGNVKKLRLAGLDVGSPSLVDANDNPAIAADGRIRTDALTLWTDGGALPPADETQGEAEGKDGRSVARGGKGQKIPGYLSGTPGLLNSDGQRQLYFDDGNNLDDLDAGDSAAAALQTALGAASTAEAKEMITWARGYDVDDQDGDRDTDEPREWIMGDPLHSRPLPLNFGTRDGYSKTNPAIFIAVASNDGFIRLIRNTTTGGAESGEEMWAFMPQAVMGELETLRINAAGIRHPYLVDGAPVAYLEDSNSNGTIDSGEKAWLFVGMRRGGKAYYALDITDPESPELLWKIEKGGDFAELGHTFSNPRVILLPDGAGSSKPGLIFGGGYDMNKDQRGAIGTDDTEGNALYIVDAETGDLVWKAVGGSGTSTSEVFYHPDLVDSVPSSVAIIDSDGDTQQDRAYFGDTGGNVWRADMVGSDTSKWKLSLLASMGRHAPLAGGLADDRRFFHRPDLVQNFDKDGPYDAVVIGSGDRADPLDAGGVVTNWMYMIKDRAVKPGSGSDRLSNHTSFGDITNTCIIPDGDCLANLSNGWRLQLESLGEKSLATALTIGNTIYFSTYVPAAGSSQGACAPSAGGGRLYAVSLADGRARNNYDQTTDEEERFDELDSLGIPAEVVSLPPNSILRPDLKTEETNTTTRFQTFWFEEEDADL